MALAAFLTGILILIQYLTDELDPHPSLTTPFFSSFCWPRKTFLYTRTTTMAGTVTFPQSYVPQFATGIIQVTSQSMGQFLVDSIREQFPHQKTLRGDFYLDQTNQVLDTHLSLIKRDDQHTIKVMLETLV
jgi:hypothetical protein